MAKFSIVKYLPLFRAPFYFGPEYLASPTEWHSNFSKLVGELLHDSDLPWKIMDSDGQELIVRFERTVFKIYPKQGTFDVEEQDQAKFDADDEEGWLWGEGSWPGLVAFPTKFSEAARNSELKEPLRTEIGKISHFADLLFSRMNKRLDTALRTGSAHYAGRMYSVGADFSNIELDQFQRLRIRFKDRDPSNGGPEDIDLDDAETEQQEKIYSLCVVPEQTIRASDGSLTGQKPKLDNRYKFSPEDYDPIIEECIATVKKESGVHATQAAVKRLASAKFKERGMAAIPNSTFDARVHKLFFKK